MRDLGFGITISEKNERALERGNALADRLLPVKRAEWNAMTVPELKALVATMRSTRGMQVKQHYIDALESKFMEACYENEGYRREH